MGEIAFMVCILLVPLMTIDTFQNILANKDTKGATTTATTILTIRFSSEYVWELLDLEVCVSDYLVK